MLRKLGDGDLHSEHNRPVFSIGYAALLLAGPLSLFVAPQPAPLVLAYAFVGIVAGVLCLPRKMFPALLALGVLLVGVDYVTDEALRRAPELQIPWWQPFLVTTTTWIGLALVPGILRRFRL